MYSLLSDFFTQNNDVEIHPGYFMFHWFVPFIAEQFATPYKHLNNLDFIS